MKRKVSESDAGQSFDELLEAAFHHDDEIVIERAGKPMAVLISAARYEVWNRKREQDRERLFDMIEDIQRRNADTPPEVIEREIQKAIDEVRQEQRERRAQGEE